jgi:hypothetical protein
VALAAALTVPVFAADPPSRRDADLLKQKLAGIVESAVAAHSRSTVVPEAELNAYLVHEMASHLPRAVTEPSVTLVGGGRLVARAVVNLERVRDDLSAAAPLGSAGLLGGQLPLEVRGTLHAKDGLARLELESASIGGVPVPTALVAQIVPYYTQSPRYPSGVRLDDAFELPARIQEIQIERGRAIVVQ